MSTGVCTGYLLKPTFFPGPSVSFGKKMNQKEIEYCGNVVDVKQKNDIFSQTRPSQTILKSCKSILHLTHPEK